MMSSVLRVLNMYLDLIINYSIFGNIKSIIKKPKVPSQELATVLKCLTLKKYIPPIIAPL